MSRHMTDAQALRSMSPAARQFIRARGWLRCRREGRGFHGLDCRLCDCLRAGLVPLEARPYSHGALRR